MAAFGDGGRVYGGMELRGLWCGDRFGPEVGLEPTIVGTVNFGAMFIFEGVVCPSIEGHTAAGDRPATIATGEHG